MAESLFLEGSALLQKSTGRGLSLWTREDQGAIEPRKLEMTSWSVMLLF